MAIEEGEAEVTRDGEHVADLGPGDFFGEMGLLEKTLRNATVTAKTPMLARHAHGLGPEAHGAAHPRGDRARARRRSKSAAPAEIEMAARIVLFGATGYTGRLAAEAMVERGLRPVLAARTRRRSATAGGGARRRARDRAAADVADPPRVAELVERGDVLVTTVGPFARLGRPPRPPPPPSGAHYIDSTGEPPFVREVFERYGPAAEGAGIGMVTAFGYDWVPGNLAGGARARARRRAGDARRRRLLHHRRRRSIERRHRRPRSSGAIASDQLRVPRRARADGARRQRGCAASGSGSKELSAISVGSSEHFTLPRIAPRLREVNAYLGWFGPASRAMQVVSAGTSVAMKVPGVEKLWSAAGERFVKGSTGGPDADAAGEGRLAHRGDRLRRRRA